MTGIDTCEAVVEICLQKSLNASIMNCCHLQYEDNSFDNIMSIAVFHHLSTEERRIKALSEMIRVLKPNGTGFVSLWSFENQNHIKNKFIQGDNLVNWKHSISGQLFQRYYHIFDESKVTKYFDQFYDIKLIHKINVLGNWYIKFVKLVY
jgi:ubiquinone/menaquinone biosynthesis C-methylase UbiE